MTTFVAIVTGINVLTAAVMAWSTRSDKRLNRANRDLLAAQRELKDEISRQMDGQLAALNALRGE